MGYTIIEHSVRGAIVKYTFATTYQHVSHVCNSTTDSDTRPKNTYTYRHHNLVVIIWYLNTNTETGSPDQPLMYHIEVIWNPQICGGFSPLHELVSGETLYLHSVLQQALLPLSVLKVKM